MENLYIDKLDYIINECNYKYHITIKMKRIKVKDNTYIDSIKEVNYKYSESKVADHGRTSKYKNILAKVYCPNWSKEIFVIKEVISTVPRTYVFSDLTGEESIGTFHKKELQKTNQHNFRIEK